MKKEKPSKIILEIFLVLIIVCMFYFGYSLLSIHPLIPVIMLLVCPSIAFLFSLNGEDKFAGESVKGIIILIMVVNILFSWYCLYHDKSGAYLNKFLFGGKVHAEKGEAVDPEENESYDVVNYTYEGESSTGRSIVDWTYLILIFLSPGLIFLSYKKFDPNSSYLNSNNLSGEKEF